MTFIHEALFYDDPAGFLASTVPFLLDGIEQAEPALVAVPPAKAEAIREALPPVGGLVRYVDVTDVGRNPGRLISRWADFLAEIPAGWPVRGVGEPVWQGRSAEEIAEAQRHEMLLNVAFGDRVGFTLLCPYDSSVLDPAVLADVRSSHPLLVREGVPCPSDDYDRRVAPYDGALPEPTGPVEGIALPEHSLSDVRRWVAARGAAAGLADERLADIVLAASEAATNTFDHAGGRGEVRLWRDNGRLVCEVRDPGRIRDPLAGRLRVAFDEPSGRGLWLINQLCDLVQIRSSAAGNVVRMHMNAP